MAESTPPASSTFAPALTGGALSADALRAILTRNQIFPNAVGQLVTRDNRWSDFSPRLVADYHFSEDVMGYASLAKGYKAGGYNGVQPGSQFAPEKVWNAEVGVESRFPEQHLLLNASVYHYRYTDKQTLVVVPSTSGLGVPSYQVSNTSQDATGLDLQVQWLCSRSRNCSWASTAATSTRSTPAPACPPAWIATATRSTSTSPANRSTNRSSRTA
ncbi:TonB-dependent receptor domain-containing protein [Rhodanobacter lindaniclasticus]